jgi:hypothetical protein
MIYEKLATPLTVRTRVGNGWIDVQATHRIWGRLEIPYNDPPMVSFFVYAQEQVDPDDKVTYLALPGTDDKCEFDADDYLQLRVGNTQGKRQDEFRNTDVIAIHKRKKGIS